MKETAMMIDMHAHWRPAEVADALRARTREPRILRNPDGVEVLKSGRMGEAPLAEAFDEIDFHLAPRPGDAFPKIAGDTDNARRRNGTLDMQASLSSVMVTLSLTDYLADYPDAMVHVHNLGGNIPYEVERMDHRCLLDTPNEELPSSRFRKAAVYVDCNSFGPRAIEAAVRLYGAERIVCGTDGTEFGCDWTRKALAEADIGEEAREQILHRNAAAMLARVARTAQRESTAA